MLASLRVITTNTGVVWYDVDFYPCGGESAITFGAKEEPWTEPLK
jgi:hypothetical protein